LESLLETIIPLLATTGPFIVFIITATETAFFIGLLVPAEATVLVAAFMADLGYFSVESVLVATIAGGFAGDQIGYLLGRFAGRKAAAGGGRIGRMWQRYEPRAMAMFRRRTIVAVSAARFVSFVRTLMPWFAGMSEMPYLRFLVYDLLGVIGWGGASVAAGYMAGRSWQVLAGALGTASALIVAALIITALVVNVRRRRQAAAQAGTSALEGGDPLDKTAGPAAAGDADHASAIVREEETGEASRAGTDTEPG